MLDKYLDIALDCGILEASFWDMTIAEIQRHIKSYYRQKEAQQKETAAHNYILANLIGRSIATYFSEEIEMLKIEEAYPDLFTENAKKTIDKHNELETELAIARFKQFAIQHNKNF